MKAKEPQVRRFKVHAAAAVLVAVLAGAGPGAAIQSDWEAAKAAQACAGGGQVLRVSGFGEGYSVRILVGSKVVVVRIDQNGNCH
jgi:hypothetical protein